MKSTLGVRISHGLHGLNGFESAFDRFAIRREDTSIFVDLNRWFESDKDRAGWASAAIQL